MSTVIGNLRAVLGLDSTAFQQGLVQSTAGLRKIKAEATGVEKSMSALQATMRTVGAAFAAAGLTMGIRGLASMADGWSDLQSRVGLAVGSMDQAGAVMQRLSDIADRTYSSIGLTAEGFLQNASTLRDLGLSTAQALDYTEALNNAMVVSGAKGDQAARVQTALSNAMALGGLRGNDLNTILTAGGRVAELLAEEMGVTTLELRKLGKEGKLTGDVILRALVGNMETLREEADKMPATIGDAFVRIGNAVQRLVGSFDQFFGASESVAGVLVSLSTQIGRLMSYVTAAIVGFGTRFVASLVAARMATLTLSGALATLRGALVRTGIGALIVGAGELIYQFSKLVSATGSFGGALRVLGDIAGSVWTFIVEAAGAIPDGLRSVWDQVKADFLQMVQSLQVAWGQFVAGLGADLQSRRFSRFGAFKGMAEDMQNAGLDIQKSAYESQQAIDDLAASAGKAGERAAGAVSAAVSKLSSDVSAALEGAKKVSDELGQALPLPPDLAGGAGAGAGAKKGGRKSTQERPFFESVQAELVNLQRQLQLIGKTKEESAALQARWQMLDEAKRRGIPINETLNAQIDSYASRVGRLTGELERAEIAQQQFDQAVDGIADAFAGALVAGESLREGLAQVFKQIASDLIKSGITRMIGSLFLGGGGGFFGLRIPGFATGGQHGGGWRIVGERGPELEATGPARYFTAAQTQQMLAGGGGGGELDVRVYMDSGGNWQAEVARIAGRVSATVVGETGRRQSDRSYLAGGA